MFITLTLIHLRHAPGTLATKHLPSSALSLPFPLKKGYPSPLGRAAFAYIHPAIKHHKTISYVSISTISRKNNLSAATLDEDHHSRQNNFINQKQAARCNEISILVKQPLLSLPNNFAAQSGNLHNLSAARSINTSGDKNLHPLYSLHEATQASQHLSEPSPRGYSSLAFLMSSFSEARNRQFQTVDLEATDDSDLFGLPENPNDLSKKEVYKENMVSLKSSHEALPRIVAVCLSRGMTPSQIAAYVDFPEEKIKTIAKSDVVVNELKLLTLSSDAAQALKNVVLGAQLDSIFTLISLRDDTNEKGNVRFSAAAKLIEMGKQFDSNSGDADDLPTDPQLRLRALEHRISTLSK